MLRDRGFICPHQPLRGSVWHIGTKQTRSSRTGRASAILYSAAACTVQGVTSELTALSLRRSRALYAFRVHVNAVQGRGSDNKHLITVLAPKRQVRHNLRYMNEGKPGTVGMKDLDSDRAATEDPASVVQPKPVGQPLTLSDSGEDPRVAQRAPVYDIEYADVVKTLVTVR